MNIPGRVEKYQLPEIRQCEERRKKIHGAGRSRVADEPERLETLPGTQQTGSSQMLPRNSARSPRSSTPLHSTLFSCWLQIVFGKTLLSRGA